MNVRSALSSQCVWLRAEEVRHGDITVGIKRVWNVITVNKYSFHCLRGILLPLLLEVTAGTGPVDALEVRSSNSNTKVSRPRKGP